MGTQQRHTVEQDGDSLVAVVEELAAMATEQTKRSLFVLTLVTVLLLPFNVVGGLSGMNVGGIPYGDSPHGSG